MGTLFLLRLSTTTLTSSPIFCLPEANDLHVLSSEVMPNVYPSSFP